MKKTGFTGFENFLRTFGAGLACLLAMLMPCHAAQKTQFDTGKISLRWELLTSKPRNTEQLTLTNKSRKSFPAFGWTIYFSYPGDIDPKSPTGGIKITHINGDVYRLDPADGFAAPAPGKSVLFTYASEGRIYNRSMAPSGMYIVWEDRPDKGFAIKDFSLAPITDPTAGFVTPEQIYAKNSLIADLPENSLQKIIPTPVSYKKLEGNFILTSETAVLADTAFMTEAVYLQTELAKMLTHKPKAPATKIYLRKADGAPEAYTLLITTQAVTITAADAAGIFYGIQSLRAQIPPADWAKRRQAIAIEATEIKDAPRFAYRGLLIDVARNFKTPEEMKKVLDLMAFYKLNTLHFHITDDEGWRLEIPALPELTQVGGRRGHSIFGDMLPPSFSAGPEAGKTLASGFYTRRDFIDLLRYASVRHIQVIPEIESPGHSRAAIKAMDMRYKRLKKRGDPHAADYLLRDLDDKSQYSSAQSWNDNVICVALPSTYRFLETVIGAVQDMYREAGAPLATIHMGGDEVPAGTWEQSPASQKLIKDNPYIKDTAGLWDYYFSKAADLLKARGLYLSGWEEAGLRGTMLDGKKKMIPNPVFSNANFRVHVWNNMIGWGAEDLPYRLANAGYRVVLSCVSNNYFDLAYMKSPDEIGYYWGGFEDIDKPFYFSPFDYYKTTREDAAGNPADPAFFTGKDRLTDYGKAHIDGIEGLLWGENMTSNDAFEYMLLPKLIALSERAWAPSPLWAEESDKEKSEKLYNQSWSEFVNVLSKRELPRLDYMSGGFAYRVPPPGAEIKDGRLYANVQFPSFVLRYTTNGKEPSVKSTLYKGPVKAKSVIKVRAFNAAGRGGSTTTIGQN